MREIESKSKIVIEKPYGKKINVESPSHGGEKGEESYEKGPERTAG